MKVPKSVRIAGQRWKISVRPENDDGDAGETNPDTQTISLYTDWHEKHGYSLKATLFHELIHAALHSTGAKHACGGEEREETIVSAIEQALWPLIEAGLLG